MNTHATNVGQAMGTNQPKFRPNGASGGSPPLGVGQPLAGAKLAHLQWVMSFGLLERHFVGIPQRWGDLIWVCPYSPLFWVLFCLVVGLLPLGLVSYVYNVVFLVYFRFIFVQSWHVLLQMNNHQNSWNWLIISPNSKFGVYFSSFYMKVGS